MSQPFYRAFEDRYRGSRELIKSRQQIYLPFILPLKKLYSECSVLDLGCGRGEWLEVLLENNFLAKGVDLDEGMLEGCNTLNLPVEQGEALASLKGLANESWSVISGFHIVEHMPFSDLRDLVAEAFRVLKPAGLLILETPNIENLVVGASDFYLDPTHARPIPHLLLSFLTEYVGFKRSKLLRLQESPQLADSESLGLMNVLNGVSPDYAVVAQKAAPDHQLSLFDQVFEKEYGLGLDELAQKYEDGLQRRFAELIGQYEYMKQRADRAESLALSVSNQLEQQRREIEAKISQMEERLRSTYEAKLDEMSTSLSWRVTWPIRASRHVIIWLLRSTILFTKTLVRRTVRLIANNLLKRPLLYRSLVERLRYHFPQFFAHLRQFALHHRIIHADINRSNSVDLSNFPDADLNLLTPRAREIYGDLKRALAEKKEF